ncbi:MAG: hypothetical protein GY867_05380 [bacterium]|nr:hypothetical protein [bacterium]
MSHFDITRAQAKAWSILARSFNAGRVASTYLFYGREGLGDWSLAVEFAALLNCEKPVPDAEEPTISYPCGECPPCRSVRGLNYEGLHFVVPIRKHKKDDEAIDLTNEILEQKRKEPLRLLDNTAATNIPINLAREVRKNLTRRGSEGVTRVVVFYQMEKMRTSSADALLKLIEEPPQDTVIILTTARSEDLLPTIQSRSQKIRLNRPPEQMTIDYLQSEYGLSETQARLVTRISGGVPGVALELAGEVDSEDSSRRGVGLLLFKSLFAESGARVVSQMTELINYTDRGQVKDILSLWQSLIRDCALHAATGEEDDLVNVDYTPEIKRLSPRFADSSVAAAMASEIKNTLADLELNVHIQAALVALALKLRCAVEAPARNTA